MLLQTNSYIVPKEKRAEHARLMRRFRQILNRIGCDNFEVYEQVGANWSATQTTGRFVQIMRFRDRKHQMSVQNAERTDVAAQQLIAEFCELVNYPLQQQQQQFAVGFYSSVLPIAPSNLARPETAEQQPTEEAPAAAGVVGTSLVGDNTAPEYVASIEDETVAETAAAETPEATTQATPEQPQEDFATDAILEDENPAAASPAEPMGDASAVVHETEALSDNPAHAAEPAAPEAGEAALSEDDLLGVVSAAPAEAHPESHPAGAPGNGDMNHLADAPILVEEDDISRLAEELASTDEQKRAASHPASENGAH